MFKGLLRVTGTIDINTLWPHEKGKCDADTLKVTVDPNGFAFSRSGKEGDLRPTHVFDHAKIKGDLVVSKGKVTIRLDRVDACELHYQAPLKGTKNYRQYFGETATAKLYDLLAGANQEVIRCQVRTRVDHPNDVFDTYGRLIGDVIVDLNGTDENLNHWLVKNGWAFPAFYNSALPNEVREMTTYAEEAKDANKGVWEYLSNDVGYPDFSLLFRPDGTPDEQADHGPVVIPKLFRRQVLWHVSQVNNKFSGPFRKFLATQKNDGWAKTSNFLRDPTVKPSAKNLSTLVDEQDKFTLGPAELVFFEKSSTLVDAKGKRITKWWAEPAKVVPKTAKAIAA